MAEKEEKKESKKATIIAAGKGKMSFPELLEKINEKYGSPSAPVVIAPGHTAQIKYPRFPTGAIELDYAMGGGLPIGRTALFFGGENTGKTLSALMCTAGAQHVCRYCSAPLLRTPTPEWGEWASWCADPAHPLNLYEPKPELVAIYKAQGFEVPERPHHYAYTHLDGLAVPCVGDKTTATPCRTVWQDAEGVFDITWSERVGADMEYVYLVRTEFAEQGIDIGDAMLRSGECDFLVVDSVAALTPMVEIEETAENWQMGVQARLVNKAVRKWISSVNSIGIGSQGGRVRPTILLLNHIHMSMVQYGSPETIPGGKNQGYASSVEVKFKRSDFELDEVAEQKSAKTAAINFVVVKNKTASPHREGAYTVWLRDSGDHRAGEVDDTLSVLKKANALGFVKHEKVFWVKGAEPRVHYLNREQADAAVPAAAKDAKRAVSGDDRWWCTLFQGDVNFFEKKEDLIEFLKEPQTFAKLRAEVIDRMLKL